jgi:nucleoid-associated protein YgaU
VPSEPLVLRKQPDSRNVAIAQASPVASPARVPTSAPAEPRRLSPTIVRPTNQPAPPPDLPRNYPNGEQPSGTRWGASLREMLPETASTPPTHKIIDGDSLAMLAERYLGSASRAMEIYEANRNVLAHPEILPIGMELRIPRAEPASTQALTQRP